MRALTKSPAASSPPRSVKAPPRIPVNVTPPVTTPVTPPTDGLSAGPKAAAPPPIDPVPTTPGAEKLRPPSSEPQSHRVLSASDPSSPGFGTVCGYRCDSTTTWSLTATTSGPWESAEYWSAPGGTSRWTTSQARALRGRRQ